MARSAIGCVVTPLPLNRVISVTGNNRIVPFTTHDGIITAASVQTIIAGTTIDRIAPTARHDHVVTITGLNRIAT
jgi:uncharacterized protein (DUF4213/DUF364 family)